MATPDQFSDKIADEFDPPSPKWVNWALLQADNTAPGAVVHPQGTGPNDVSRGDHTHDGSNSQYLFDATPVLSALPANATSAQMITAINSIITHLSARGAGVSRS